MKANRKQIVCFRVSENDSIFKVKVQGCVRKATRKRLNKRLLKYFFVGLVFFLCGCDVGREGNYGNKYAFESEKIWQKKTELNCLSNEIQEYLNSGQKEFQVYQLKIILITEYRFKESI